VDQGEDKMHVCELFSVEMDSRDHLIHCVVILQCPLCNITHAIYPATLSLCYVSLRY
jgi:hypothetical protein